MVEHSGDDLADPRRMSWARLVGDHDRIARQCAALVALARREDHPAEDAAVLLLELAVCVADHLGIEDQVIDLTVTAASVGTSPEDVAVMVEALEALKADWTDFIIRWPPAAVIEHWPDFVGEADSMMSRLSDQVRYENELLYAEALRRGLIDHGRPVLH